ncbi:MAG TPA: hypothetical protein VFV38_48615 [Ktedonobacteraceae bacterium]|nr:hypothetical protein [Ktedonobacteraceae bacterium]
MKNEKVLRRSLIKGFSQEHPASLHNRIEGVINGLYKVVDCPLYDLTPEHLYSAADSFPFDFDTTNKDWEQNFKILRDFVTYAVEKGAIKRDLLANLARGIPSCLGNTLIATERAFRQSVAEKPFIAENVSDGPSSVDPNVFRALYFPYARSFSHLFLKQALLVFDELWFLDPLERASREAICYYNAHGNTPSSQWNQFIEIYDQLYEANFVKIFSDFLLIREYDLLLQAAIGSDIADEEFSSLVFSSVGSNQWSIHRDRLPTSTRSIQWPESWKDRGTGYSSPWYKSPPTKWPYNDYSPYIDEVAHSYVHPVIGLSATINQALLTCGLRGLIPITDSDTSLNLLRIKYQRALKANGELQTNLQMQESNYASITGRLAFHLVRSIIPRQEIEKRTYSELLKYRETSHEHLKRFQVKLKQLSADLQTSFWEPNFELEVARLLDREIIPEVQKLRDDLKAIYEKMFGQIIGAVVKTASPSIVLSAFPGLGFHEILAWGVTIGTGLTAISIQPLIDAWNSRRDLKRNGLVWLIDLER